MAKTARQANDMEHVWKDISDIWGKLDGKKENAAPFALTRQIAKAGRFTEAIVEKIYARFEFCEGFTNKQLERLKTLGESAKGKTAETPEEVKELQETLAARAQRENVVKLNTPEPSHWSEPAPEPVENTNGEDRVSMCWQSFSQGSKETWPERKQNVVFGTTFSHPISARFENGQWFRHGTGDLIKNVTKYLHVPPPEDWT